MDKYIVGKEIFDALKLVSSFIPTPIYWEDTNSVILGANKHVLTAVGLKSLDDYIGKNLYELYPKEIADNIKIHNEQVMRKGKILSQEEYIKDISTGEIKYYTAIKAPLYDSNGNIIGIIGTSVDITDRKKMEEELKAAKIAAEMALQAMKQAQIEEQKHREKGMRTGKYGLRGLINF